MICFLQIDVLRGVWGISRLTGSDLWLVKCTVADVDIPFVRGADNEKPSQNE
jgi:hypothetical protein